MDYQVTLDTDSPTRNSLTYYGAWPMMIVWGLDRFIRFVSLISTLDILILGLPKIPKRIWML